MNFKVGAALVLLLVGFARVGRAEEKWVELSPSAHAAMRAVIAENPGERSARAIAPTGSMEPTLDENFIAIVEQRPFAKLKRGDIVGRRAWWSDADVAHRIVTLSVWGITTQGDSVPRPDPDPMSESSYDGVVIVAAINIKTGEIRVFDGKPRSWSTRS